MQTITTSIHYILPILGLLLFIAGILTRNLISVVLSLWIALISIVFQYQMAGDEILGTYFNYNHSAIYTVSFLTLIGALFYLFFKAPALRGRYLRIFTGFFTIILTIATGLLLINLWVNAYFIEEKKPGSSIMQVVTFTPPSYCPYRYIFYKVNPEGKISYLCPNYYLLIPSVGELNSPPDFLTHQVAKQMEKK